MIYTHFTTNGRGSETVKICRFGPVFLCDHHYDQKLPFLKCFEISVKCQPTQFLERILAVFIISISSPKCAPPNDFFTKQKLLKIPVTILLQSKDFATLRFVFVLIIVILMYLQLYLIDILVYSNVLRSLYIIETLDIFEYISKFI